MQAQTAPTTKPAVNAIAEKKAVVNPPVKTEPKAEKKPKYLRYGFAELQQSIQRKRARRTALEAAIKVLDQKIEHREKRLKDLTPRQ